MAVAHDAASESHTGGTASQSEASFSWTHTPAGTPKGVVVFVASMSSVTDRTTGITYGGVALGSEGVIATNGEAGTMAAWFLGSGLPTGAQTIQVSRENNSIRMYAVAATVTAGGNTDVVGLITQEGILAPSEGSVDDGSPGTNSLRYAGAYSGADTLQGPGANSTALHDINITGATFSAGAVRETTAGQGSRSVGFSGASDDWACVLLAIKEVAAAGFHAGAYYQHRMHH